MSSERDDLRPQRFPERGTPHAALVVRQPIYSQVMTVVAYELLYRESALAAHMDVVDTRQGTLRLITDAALEIGLDRLAGELPIHINYPRELLRADPPLSVQPTRVAIEVIEEIPGDAVLLNGIQALRARGHRIVLDDYSRPLNSPALLEAVDMVKIDIAQEAPNGLERAVGELRNAGRTVIAQEVDTVEQFEVCIQLGFDAFQGNFLQHPQTFRSRRIPLGRLTTLRLAATLQQDDCSIDEVERLVAQDASLALRVLRCINSSYYNLPRHVASIRQAIMLLGLDTLRQLCMLVALQSLADRPIGLLVTAATRARMCEQLARLAGMKDSGSYFLAGLCSLLDVLIGAPIQSILDELPLTDRLVQALRDGEGDIGAALKCVRAYERAAWSRVSYRDLPLNLIRTAYVDAVFWAEQTQAMVGQ